jgi:hypothetical protein
MLKDIIEEKTATLEKSLNEKFNKVVKALIQNINGKISEGERIDICNKMNQDGINEIRQALNATSQIVAREVLRKVREGVPKEIPSMPDLCIDSHEGWLRSKNTLLDHIQSLEDELVINKFTVVEIPVKGTTIECQTHGINQIVIKDGAGWCPECLSAEVLSK